MSDIANRDEGLKCWEIARQALTAGDTTRAEKFAQKALRLYRCQQTEDLAADVADALSGGSARGGRASSSQDGTPRPPQPQQQGGSSSGHSRAGHHGGSHHRHQGQQRQTGSSGTSFGGSGGNGEAFGEGVEGLRRRGAAAGGAGAEGNGAASAPAAPAMDPSVTPEQRQLVAQILKAKDYYETLELAKGADDDEIKRAYRKLALKLHPDKNKAPKAEEAFKAVSRAFSCLSDADKRAHYDRTGYESRDAAATANAGRGGAARTRSGPFGPMGGGAFYGEADIDPEEIFNMFFGAGAFGPHRVYRSHFGNPQFAQRRARTGAPPSPQEQQRGAMLGLLQLLPVLLLVFMTLFSGSADPAYSLQRDAKYTQGLATTRLQVPYYVKHVGEFEAKYGGTGTHGRTALERQVESEYYEGTHLRCQQERMTQHRMYTWGNRAKAKAMPMPGCDELLSLNDRLGIGRGGQQRVSVY